jgi:hypothetical protein
MGHESTVSPADGDRNTGAPETSFRSTGTKGGIALARPLRAVHEQRPERLGLANSVARLPPDRRRI